LLREFEHGDGLLAFDRAELLDEAIDSGERA
jgi:hypothetical protein